MPRPAPSKPPFIDQSSPAAPPWYASSPNDTTIDDRHETEVNLLTAASTPLHPSNSKSMLFTSPMRKLDNLHLHTASSSPIVARHPAICHSSPQINSSELDNHTHRQSDYGNNSDGNDSEDNDSEGNDYDEGNRTIVENSSENEEDGGQHSSSGSDSEANTTAPIFLRKRKFTDSPMDITMTPASRAASNQQNTSAADMSGVIGNETAESISKISFNTSDSTPCPSQPRKRLKFKTPLSQESTPSQPSKVGVPLLNLNSSKKLSASSVPLLSKLNSATMDSHLETPVNTSASSSNDSSTKNAGSTPISQSTPANSRPTSPALFAEASGEEVNGYSFVKPTTKYKYQTPQSRPTSAYPLHQHNHRDLMNAYNTNNFSDVSDGKYEIVGNFPVSAAGLMDENDEDVHVADKRINDPYLGPAPEEEDENEILERYLSSIDKLPLVVHFERDLTIDEMNYYINDGVSVAAFYSAVVPGGLERGNDDMLNFLKKERLKWHPDKWESKLASSHFAKSNIDNLSQVINALIDRIG